MIKNGEPIWIDHSHDEVERADPEGASKEAQNPRENELKRIARNLMEEVGKYCEGLKTDGVETFLNVVESGPDGTVIRFEVDTESIPFGLNKETSNIHIKEPLVLDIVMHQDDAGKRKFIHIKTARFQLPPEQAKKSLPSTPEQDWVLKQKDITANLDTYGDFSLLEFSRGWSTFYQEDEQGPAFTNSTRVPEITMTSMVEILKDLNTQILEAQKKAMLRPI